MVYSIFRNNILVVSVKPLDSSELFQKKQSDDFKRLNFILNDYINIQIGDYISFEKTNQIYVINKEPRVIENPKNHQYTCIFEGGIHNLKKTKILLFTEKESGGFYKDYKFPLSGTAETFLYFIVENLNRAGGNYTAGIFKDTSDINVEFNNWNAFEAISQIASQLDFDWYLDGSTLNFDSNIYDTAYVFQVGRKVGFVELIRNRSESENIETVVYGYGSTKNLPPRIADEGETYDGELLTENRLSFNGVDGESKLENNVDIYGRIESIQEFDIFPNRLGTVSSIDANNRRLFYDVEIDFDVNTQLLAGIVPKVKFITGKLIGLAFNVSFDNSETKFTMDYYTDESGRYPNDIIFADVGDTYRLFDIIMPNSYIVEASEDVRQATQDYVDAQSISMNFYEGNIDEEFIELYNLILNLGNLIRVVSTSFGIDNSYEIKVLRQNITNPNKYSIQFGDIIPKGLITSLLTNNFKTQQSIYNVQKNSVSTTNVTNIIGEDISWQGL